MSVASKRIARNTDRPVARALAPVPARRLVWLFPALLLAAFAVAKAGTAHAALYKWIDERGVVHYSDQLPADAVNRANYELNRQGLAVKKTEQARPVAQRALPKTDSEEQQVRQAERDRVIALRRDRALIESYTNEGEIDLARSRALATIEGQVQSAEAFVAQMSKRREELQRAKVTYAPRPVPGAIEREIETIDAELVRQNELIAGKKKEFAAVAARYDADRQRFRELRSESPGGVVTSDAGHISSSPPVGLKLTSTR
jgi:hypothetical protein